MKISRVLFKPERWCKGCLAVTKNGTRLHNLNIIHYQNGRILDPTSQVVAYSLQGVICHLYGPDEQGDIFIKLGNIIRQDYGQRIWLAEWNDRPETKYTDVIRILKIAGL